MDEGFCTMPAITISEDDANSVSVLINTDEGQINISNGITEKTVLNFDVKADEESSVNGNSECESTITVDVVNLAITEMEVVQSLDASEEPIAKDMIAAGGSVIYKIVITNSSSITANNVKLELDFDTNIYDFDSFVNDDEITSDAIDETDDAEKGNGKVSFIWNELASTDLTRTAHIKLNVKDDISGENPNQTNAAVTFMGAVDGDGVKIESCTENIGQDLFITPPTPQVAIYDLALVKTITNSNADDGFNIGDVVNFKIEVKNEGQVSSGDFTVTDLYPAGMTDPQGIDGTTISDHTTNERSFKLNGSNLMVGATQAFEFSLKIDDGAEDLLDNAYWPYQNWARISANSGDDCDSKNLSANAWKDDGSGITGGNAPTEDKTQFGVAGCEEGDLDHVDFATVNLKLIDLELEKKMANSAGTIINNDDDIEVGETITYTITITNNDEDINEKDGVASDASGVEVMDIIPEGLEFITLTENDQGKASLSGKEITWNVRNLDLKETKSISYTAKVLPPFKSNLPS
ncbi:MAG: hypothetical protein AAF466_02020, partial [Bacteroidota bacterium]